MNTKLVLDRLNEYTETELFFKRLYEVRQACGGDIEKALRNFELSNHEKRLLDHPRVIDEDVLFRHAGTGNVNISKHPRYVTDFLHCHNMFEMFYVVSGTCTHTLNEKRSVLPANTFVIMAPEVDHRIGVFDDSIVLNIRIRRSTFQDYLVHIMNGGGSLSRFFVNCLYGKKQIVGMQTTLKDDELTNFLLQILHEQNFSDSYTNGILNSMLGVLFNKLERHCDMEGCEYIVTGSVNDSCLSMLLHMIENLNSITLKSLADHFGYTVAHCSRMIKENTGMNFIDILRDIRLRQAESLLRSTTFSVESISDAVGYHNSASFIKVFTQKYGMSPGVYRRSQV